MNRQYRSVLLAAAVFAAAAAPAAAQQPQGGARFGYVNTERVMREAAPAQQVQKRLKTEIEKRDQEMRVLVAQLRKLEEALNRTTPPMSDAERSSRQREHATMSRDFERKKQEYAEELALRRNEAMGQVLEQANRAIRRVAEQENLDIVFQEAAYASPRVDITDKVIKVVNAGAPASWK
jgi:outer membrane protein